VKTLEAYLLDSAHDGVTSHTVSVHRGSHGEVHMRIYPQSIRGPDLQFEVRGDSVVPVDLGIVAAGPATKADVAAEVDRIAPWLDPHRHAGR
jgi:hypothetical protein